MIAPLFRPILLLLQPKAVMNIFYVHIPELGNQAYINQISTIDQGKIALQVTEIINDETIRVKFLNEGIIQSTLSIHFHQNSEDEAYLNRLRDVLTKLVEIAPDYVAIPFISPSVNEKIKQLSDFSWKPKIIARLKNHEKTEHLTNLPRQFL